ncbi:cytochrome P450, partial [Boletus edulis]
VSKRAQAEIDTVVGTDRLPDLGDRPPLPYVNATIREGVLKLSLAGVWHATSNSDIYNDQHIPEDSNISPMKNAFVRAISRDEARFPNAEDFVTERFLNDGGTFKDNDPMDFVLEDEYALVCAGQHTVDGSLFAAIATMLAILDFHPLQDAQDTCQVEWVDGITQ